MLSLIWPNTRSTQSTNTSYFKIDRPKNGGTFLGIRKKHLYSISPHLLVYSILDTTRYFKLYHISFSQFFWILCPQSKIIWVWNPFFCKVNSMSFCKIWNTSMYRTIAAAAESATAWAQSMSVMLPLYTYIDGWNCNIRLNLHAACLRL